MNGRLFPCPRFQNQSNPIGDSRWLLSLWLLVVTCGHGASWAEGADPKRPPLVKAERGMIVSVSPEASDAGIEVLKGGGNAVDAAVAVGFALAVTFPEAGNIGGGGFMMVWPGNSVAADSKPDPVCIEYRETCPVALERNSFVNESRQEGHHTVSVPGTVSGFALAHQKYGKLTWAELVAPSIRLAEDGFAIDAALAASLNRMLGTPTAGFPEFRRVYGKPTPAGADTNETAKGEWRVGDRLVQPELAATLKRIAADGPDAFYRGAIADQIVAEMTRGGGVLTKDDLSAYRANLRKPVHTTYRGHDVYAAPPPSFGGTQLVECLNILEQFDLATAGPKSPQAAHWMAEAMRRAACDRVRFGGDPEFTTIPAHLLTKDHALQWVKGIQSDKATKSESLAADIVLTDEPPSTTHFTVADGQGMAVSNTYTLQNSFGSRVVVKGAGFLLNNEMTDFNWKPGVTTRNGRVGTDPNLMAPGKRMLSSQCPTLVARDGKLLLATGSPGGRTIPSTVLCVVVNVLDFGMTVREAVDAPRWHHQWFPDRLQFERLADPDYVTLKTDLKARGHNFGMEVKVLGDGYPRQGDAHSLQFHDGTLFGAADWRRTTGKAAGW